MRTVSPSTTAGDEMASAARTSVSLITAASPDDGRACFERAAGCQSADRGFTNIVGSGQVGLDLSGSNAVEYFPALMRCQLLRATEANAARLGALAALTRTFADQLTLKLGQTAKHRYQQAPMHRRCVCPGILERAEGGATFGYLRQQVQQIARRAAQAIEAGDNHRVAFLEPAHELVQLRAIGLRARNLLAVDLDAAGGLEVGDLAGEVLVAGGNPRISDDHFQSTFESNIRNLTR